MTLTKETGYTETYLEEGEAYRINFYLSKAADESAIIHPENENKFISAMLRETLGTYPQVPYLLHTPTRQEILTAYSSVTEIMSRADGTNYPVLLSELRNYYGGQGELNRKGSDS